MLSKQNPRVKYLRRLGDRRFREREEKFFAEGIRFVEEALSSTWPVEMVVYGPKIIEVPRGQNILEIAAGKGVGLVELEESLFRELAGTDNPQGILAVVQCPPLSLAQIRLQEPALLVLVDGVQDPGNLGAIVRSADAAGAGGVILLKGTTDIYNPKASRATMGSIFHVPVIQNLAPDDIVTYLNSKGIKLVAGDSRGEKEVFRCDLTVPCALLVGSEAEGVRAGILKTVSELARIPMPGRAESLNVAVSASILLYEALRQRQFG